jgi:glycosyltransferase involved in cell wall biosynthesis
MLRVLINGWFLHKPNTGSGQYLRLLLKHISNEVSEVDIHVISPLSAQLPDNCTLHVYDTVDRHINKFIFEQITVPRIAKKIGADVLHVPYWAPPFRSPCPLVVTVHDVIPLLMPEYNHSLLLRIYTSLAAAATQGASHIITDSDSSRDDIVSHLQLPEYRVHTVYLGADDVFNPGQNPNSALRVSNKFNLPDSYILYLGGFQRHKNLRHLLAAWTWAHPIASKDCPLVIAGRLPHNPDGYIYDDLPNIATELGISDTVIFIGEVQEEDKATLYQSASCFVFPSSYEGFGLPPLEAMACGIPVITTGSGALKEIVGDAAYLVSDPIDARELGAAMISIIVDEKLASDLQGRGLIQSAKFSWGKTVVETLRIYQKCMI